MPTGAASFPASGDLVGGNYEVFSTGSHTDIVIQNPSFCLMHDSSFSLFETRHLG